MTQRPPGITAGELIEQLKNVDPESLVIYHDDYTYVAAGGAESTVIGVCPEGDDSFDAGEWEEGVDKLPAWDDSYRDWPRVPGVRLIDVRYTEEDDS